MIRLFRAPQKLYSFPRLFSQPSSRPHPFFRRNFCQKPLDINTNVSKDVILFKYENPRFFKILNIFAGSQFIFWTYLSVFAFTDLRDAPVQVDPEAAWWRRINLGENKYKNSIAVASFFLGYGVLAVTWMFTLRSVRYLILLKGGKRVAIVTYTPMGRNRIMEVDLSHISSKESRTVARTQLPLKVKNHFLHYVLDMKGEFKNPSLFDHTVGLKRSWTKTS